jgi:hypothetical protein
VRVRAERLDFLFSNVQALAPYCVLSFLSMWRELFVLTIPDSFSDLFYLPAEVPARTCQVLMQDFPVYEDTAL